MNSKLYIIKIKILNIIISLYLINMIGIPYTYYLVLNNFINENKIVFEQYYV